MKGLGGEREGNTDSRTVFYVKLKMPIRNTSVRVIWKAEYRNLK